MIALCKTNEAFEDSLTREKTYKVLELKNGSLLILNDRGQARWHAMGRFQLGRANDAF